MGKDSLTITDNRNGKTYEVPIEQGTIRALDVDVLSRSPSLADAWRVDWAPKSW